jgi:DNA gyrase subunit A
VVEGDEILSITQLRPGRAQPRSTTDFRATGRSTMGVKFVTPKKGDAVAVVARSVEAKDDDGIGGMRSTVGEAVEECDNREIDRRG